MNLIVKWTNSFKKDYKRAIKRHLKIEKLDAVIAQLASGATLDEKHRDHALSGVFEGLRECHIEPDWLLIYSIQNDTLILTLSRTGTHSDLFN